MAVTGVGQALSNSYLMFSVFAFLNAFGTAGVFPLAFVMGSFNYYFHLRKSFEIILICTGVEMVGPNKRELCGVVLNLFYSIGEAFTGLAGWYCRDWVALQYVVSAPAIIFVAYYWYKITLIFKVNEKIIF